MEFQKSERIRLNGMDFNAEPVSFVIGTMTSGLTPLNNYLKDGEFLYGEFDMIQYYPVKPLLPDRLPDSPELVFGVISGDYSMTYPHNVEQRKSKVTMFTNYLFIDDQDKLKIVFNGLKLRLLGDFTSDFILADYVAGHDFPIHLPVQGG